MSFIDCFAHLLSNRKIEFHYEGYNMILLTLASAWIIKGSPLWYNNYVRHST